MLSLGGMRLYLYHANSVFGCVLARGGRSVENVVSTLGEIVISPRQAVGIHRHRVSILRQLDIYGRLLSHDRQHYRSL